MKKYLLKIRSLFAKLKKRIQPLKIKTKKLIKRKWKKIKEYTPSEDAKTTLTLIGIILICFILPSWA